MPDLMKNLLRNNLYNYFFEARESCNKKKIKSLSSKIILFTCVRRQCTGSRFYSSSKMTLIKCLESKIKRMMRQNTICPIGRHFSKLNSLTCNCRTMWTTYESSRVVCFTITTSSISIVRVKRKPIWCRTTALIYNGCLALSLAWCFTLCDWVEPLRSHVRFLKVVWEFIKRLGQTKITLARRTLTCTRTGGIFTRKFIQMRVVRNFSFYKIEH